ncbi:Ankyrin repeat domain containing protein [Pandoravirus dulcis]|uniref:Ankyrin repeat domain containing protein n=1 Tax=Pandoravirus dulcis TaxID=1349409 RepID=S4VRM1_9VIRU|nr:Ankyrin repeat domain containing protein [Pandoravirus dulcis]AGO83003.1 Ankyrin repeat domain containing protein [Pandoravirus dulcis]
MTTTTTGLSDGGIDTLPVEAVAAVTAHLGDRDLCRARAAHRCFRVDSDETLAKRANRWRGDKTPERFCAVGLIEALEILHARGVPMGPECARAAASAGHVDVLTFLHRAGTPFDAVEMLDVGRLFTALVGESRDKAFTLALGEIVGKVIMNLAFGLSPATGYNDRRAMSLVDVAARNGHVDAVAWLARVAGVRATTMAMDCAAARGHTTVVRWLHDNCDSGCTTAAMDLAAICGYMDTVAFLHSHRTEGCTVAAMDGAAADGHADVVAFLHAHGTAGCTTAAVDSAATAGHMAVVRFLCENRAEGFTRATIRETDAAGHARVAAYLARRAGPSDTEDTIRGPFAPCVDGDDDDDDDDLCAGGQDAGTRPAHGDTGTDLHVTFLGAVLKGDIAAMDRIHHEQGLALDDPAPRMHHNYWAVAAMVGRLDVIEWLHAHNAGGRDCGIVTVALVTERLDVARWLYEHGARDSTAEMIDDAAAEGAVDPVRTVYDQWASILGSIPGVRDMIAQVCQLADTLCNDDASHSTETRAHHPNPPGSDGGGESAPGGPHSPTDASP